MTKTVTTHWCWRQYRCLFYFHLISYLLSNYQNFCNFDLFKTTFFSSFFLVMTTTTLSVCWNNKHTCTSTETSHPTSSCHTWYTILQSVRLKSMSAGHRLLTTLIVNARKVDKWSRSFGDWRKYLYKKVHRVCYGRSYLDIEITSVKV